MGSTECPPKKGDLFSELIVGGKMASNQKVGENRPPLKFNFTDSEVFSACMHLCISLYTPSKDKISRNTNPPSFWDTLYIFLVQTGQTRPELGGGFCLVIVGRV